MSIEAQPVSGPRGFSGKPRRTFGILTLVGLLPLLLAADALAWAILLSAPTLLYPSSADAGAIAAVENEMKALEFDGGIIHVTAPEPRRTLRFSSPGQTAIKLLGLLEKVGFKVTVSFSELSPKGNGFVLAQPEDGSDTVAVVVNSQHPKFEKGLLKPIGGLDTKPARIR